MIVATHLSRTIGHRHTSSVFLDGMMPVTANLTVVNRINHKGL